VSVPVLVAGLECEPSPVAVLEMYLVMKFQEAGKEAVEVRLDMKCSY